MRTAVILPSRNETATITAVTTAVDTALDDVHALIVHADSSDAPDTAGRFTATATRAAKTGLTDLPRGKGAQILKAAELADADVVLIADTDTRSPDPAVYAALVDRVRAGAALAVADYPRHWDEANLTNHLARPLIAATTGHDIPQPLAGDLALSRDTLTAVRHAAHSLPGELAACVDGYGIDAFILLTAAKCGPLASVRVGRAKRHAGSFPHLAAIYHQAAPVLLHLTRAPLADRVHELPAPYRISDRTVAPDRLRAMLTTLRESLGPGPDGYHERPWPLPVADAWHAVNSGMSPVSSARELFPHYLRRVHAWLSGERHEPRRLAEAHTLLHTALRTPPGALP